MALAVKLFVFLVTYGFTTWAASSTEFIRLQCPAASQGVHGEDSVIQCSVTSSYPDVKIVALVWKRPASPRPLLSFLQGILKHNERFQLAEPNWNQSNTQVSLLVRETSVADDGTYLCMVLTDQGMAQHTVNLQVTAKYMGITMTSIPQNNIEDEMAVEMSCSALGGYPEGSIQWFDQYNTDWTRSSKMVAKRMADGRFHIISKFAVQRVSSGSPKYRCCLVNSEGHMEAEAELHLKFAAAAGEVAKIGLINKAIVLIFIILGSLTCGFLLLALFFTPGCLTPHEESYRLNV